MPRPRTHPRWDIPGCPRGYIESRPSRIESRPPAAVAVWCGCEKALGVPFLEEYRREAQQRAKRWIGAIETGKIPNPKNNRGKRRRALSERATAHPLNGTPITISAAQAAFTNDRLTLTAEQRSDRETVRKHAIRMEIYTAMFGSIFTTDGYLTDATLHDTIKRWLHDPRGVPPEPGVEGKRLAASTRDALIGRLLAFIRYCIARKWITSNPFDLMPRPKRAPKRRKDHYDLEIRKKLVRAAATIAAAARRELPTLKRRRDRYLCARRLQLPNLLRVQGLLGMRIGETVSIMWRDHAPEGYNGNWIDSEIIHLAVTKTGEPRSIPWRMLPRWCEVIEYQRRFIDLNRGKLFPWTDIESAIRDLRPIFAGSGAILPYNWQHMLRGITGEYLLAQGFSDTLVARILGHDVAMLRRIYLDRPTPQSMGEEIATEMASVLASKGAPHRFRAESVEIVEASSSP